MNGNGLAPATRAGLIQACVTIVGRQGVITAPDELRVNECDALTVYHRSMPDLVVLPTSTQQVAALVHVCYDAGVPVVARVRGPGSPAARSPRPAGS